MKYELKEKVAPKLKAAAEATKEAAKHTAEKSKDILQKSQAAVVEAIDLNGDGQIDVEDIIIWGLRTPGIRVDRENFLRKEFFKNYEPAVIDDAVAFSPAHAHISTEEIDKIADEVIKYERNCVTGISAALGMPGGAAMAATIPADIIQYYGYMLRATQKLLYLYGFPEIDTSEKGQKLDSATLNILILCLGVMYGVAGANKALAVMAKALADGVEKKLLKTALTKGTIYPIVRKVAAWFNVHMTKAVFAGAAKKAIPLIGGAVGGTITFLSFKPCCDKLRDSLRDTALTDPNHVVSQEARTIIDAIEYEEQEQSDS